MGKGGREDPWNWAPAWGVRHLSGWAESGCARHRAEAAAETGTVLQEMRKVLRRQETVMRTSS